MPFESPLSRFGINLRWLGEVRRRYSTPVYADPLDAAGLVSGLEEMRSTLAEISVTLVGFSVIFRAFSVHGGGRAQRRACHSNRRNRFSPRGAVLPARAPRSVGSRHAGRFQGCERPDGVVLAALSHDHVSDQGPLPPHTPRVDDRRRSSVLCVRSQRCERYSRRHRFPLHDGRFCRSSCVGVSFWAQF